MHVAILLLYFVLYFVFLIVYCIEFTVYMEVQLTCHFTIERCSSVVHLVVGSRKLTKIDPQLLWNTATKLVPLTLLPHSDPLQSPPAAQSLPPPWGMVTASILGKARSTRHPLCERYRLDLSISVIKDLFGLARCADQLFIAMAIFLFVASK